MPIEEPSASPTSTLRKTAHWIVLIGATVFGGTFIYGGAISMLRDPSLYQLALQHFPAVVGLPSAAIASLCIVVVLEGTAGPVEFETLGLKFKGAAGPIVFWVLCFLAITAAIHLLW